MRITENSTVAPYLRNLQDVQTRLNLNQLRISTGKAIINISDDPKKLASSKNLTTFINRNNYYLDNIEKSIEETQAVDEQIDAISEKYMNLRELAIDSTVTGNLESLSSLAVNVKGILTDLVRDANYDVGGKYLFSGTATTPDSVQSSNAVTDDLPFEIIEGTATTDNPSGLSVVFKGNNEDRIINTDESSSEVINVKADTLFGKDGTEMFDAIIDLYNVIAYDDTGAKRDENSIFSTTDTEKLNTAQQKISNYYDVINIAGAKNGSRMNRLELMREQLVNENSRLEDFRSIEEDTDTAKASLELAKDQNALDYSLKIGSQLFPASLFDYLA
jgi:flagellar hook-associated protein 3 FlgL